MAEGSQVWRLSIDQTDAPMPWLREAKSAKRTRCRVSFASPSTIHQEALMTTYPDDLPPLWQDWRAELQHLREAEEYQREQIATAQSEQAFEACLTEYRLRMRAGTKRTATN